MDQDVGEGNAFHSKTEAATVRGIRAPTGRVSHPPDILSHVMPDLGRFPAVARSTVLRDVGGCAPKAFEFGYTRCGEPD